jgi:phosphopantothenoylcysteine decarboxylase/phosphopantothenate--cysteine ligase
MNILVTAGPTRELIDPVRYISNRSSGKMGYAVASAALALGHKVVLVSGPATATPPRGVRLIRVETALQMLKVVRKRISWCDALVMAAAVCDIRPRLPSRAKIKKECMPGVLRLALNPDILRSVATVKGRHIFVGFAAETSRIVDRARRKLWSKKLDLIVANDVTRKDSGFDADTNRVVMLADDGTVNRLPLMTKRRLGRIIVQWIEKRRVRRG